MKNLLLLLVIAFAVTTYANEYIVKDPARPQGLYVVGPDISTDSTASVILYYSDDDGYSLTRRNVFDWMGTRYNDLAADVTEDIVYMTTRGRYLYISYNGGEAWELQYTNLHYESELRTGTCFGYMITHSGSHSTNFGEEWIIIPRRLGLYGDYITPAEIGFSLGEGYLLNSDGILFRTNNYFDSLYVINDLGRYELYYSFFIFRGCNDGELYVRKDSVIYYSSNYGETFTETGREPDDPVANEIISGDEAGELFACRCYINLVHGEARGGHIVIRRSTDYGATWNIIRDHHAAIEEIHAIASTSEPFYTQTGSMVTSDENVLLFDIQGKLLRNARCINLSNYQNGLYIITKGEQSSKVLNIE